MAISEDSFEALIKPDLHEEFKKDKYNWFITPLAPQGKCTPGLSKVEFYEAPTLPKLLRTINGVAVKLIGCDALTGWSVS